MYKIWKIIFKDRIFPLLSFKQMLDPVTALDGGPIAFKIF